VNYDDETLMAYADGELDPAQRAQIAAAIDRDPALARRVEKHLALRAQLAGAFAAVIEQPVPERLVAAASGAPAASRPQARGQVLQFPKRGAQGAGPRWRAREWFAMAASVLVGVAISWRVFSPEGGLMDAKGGALVARGELAAALDRQLASTQSPDSRVLIGMTFRGHDGGFCRSFTLRATNTAGLACRTGGEWEIPVTASAATPTGQMQQAAGSTPPAVLAAIESRIQGDALDAAGEENAHLGGWKPAN
jgi:hypothetical protein